MFNIKMSVIFYRYASIACLLLLVALGLLLPSPARAQVVPSACKAAGGIGANYVVDTPPASYDGTASPTDVVWYGPVHTFTLTCAYATTQAGISTQPGAVAIMLTGYTPGMGDFNQFPNLQLGVLVNSRQIWNSGSGITLIDGVTLPACQVGQKVCPSTTFQVALQLDLRYMPNVTVRPNTAATACAWSYANNTIAGCENFNMDGGGPILTLGPASGGGPQPVTPTCGFQTNNVNFPLGTINALTLANAGSSSPWVTGNLVSTGCKNVKQLNLTFSAPSDSADGSLFQVSGGASGVAIQLQTATGTPVTPNSASPIMLAPQPAGGSYPFQARYLRTSAPLNGGEGDAKITVNITYQ